MAFNQRAAATRVDRALLRRVAASVADANQRDEMAGPSYLHRIPWIRWVFWKRLDVVAQLLDLGASRDQSGLDFGCGLGVLLPTLSARTDRVYAADLVLGPARQLASALRLPNVTFIDPAQLPALIPASSLDYLVSTDVLEHVEDLDAIVSQFATALKPGARLVVSGPTENVLYKAGRVMAGFGGKGHYHHTDIHRIHELIIRRGEFQMTACRILPVPHLVEGFYLYSYARKAG